MKRRRADVISSQGAAAYEQALEALRHGGQELGAMGSVFPLLRDLPAQLLPPIKDAAERLSTALAEAEAACSPA